MTQGIYNSAQTTGRTLAGGYLFGVPVKDLGWFASLLIGCASGMLAFFVGTFVGIFGILILNMRAHGQIDYAYSYQRVGIPLGLLVGVCALGYLGFLWVRRLARRS